MYMPLSHMFLTPNSLNNNNLQKPNIMNLQKAIDLLKYYHEFKQNDTLKPEEQQELFEAIEVVLNKIN